MNIGILTFHEADSYGAVLQAYALQHTLSKMGADSEFVQINSRKAPEQQPAMTGAAAIFARKLQEEGKKREALFAQFRSQHLKISEPYESGAAIDDRYDSFVAGSDQIWNFRIPGADARYFLPFASPKKRYSYAASFGAEELPEQAKSWVADQLAQFREISVREESGCRIVKELTGREATLCLDPTLLVEREDWELLCEKTETEPYVLLFLLKYDEALVSKAKAEAEQRGIALRVVTAAFMPQLGMAAWNGTGVTEWLSAIRNAQCVFTNSFHGIVFSIMFGREFHVERLGGELSSRNGRIDELLAFLQFTDAFDGVAKSDYDRVWELLGERRAASFAYLRKVMDHDAAI